MIVAPFESALDYQRETSYERNTLSGGPLDWSNQPQVFKRYRSGREVVLPVPEDWPRSSLAEVAILTGAKGTLGASEAAGRLTLPVLSRVLGLAYGITAEANHGGEPFYYRSVPSAGALYPCELYLAAQAVEGLVPGLYHYQVGRHRLTELRPRARYGAIGGLITAPPEPEPGLAIFITTLFFRGAWKYRKRCYRYLLLDSGHLLENLDLALKLMGLAPVPALDFDDLGVNRLLGLDPEREAALAAVWLAGKEAAPEAAAATAPAIERLQPVEPEACRCAPRDQSYPEIEAIHRLSSRVAVAAQPDPELLDELGLEVAVWTALEDDEAIPVEPPRALADLIRSRRSRRNFVPKALAPDGWRALLLDLCRPGWYQPVGACAPDQAVCVGLIAERLTGLDPGFYLLDRSRCRIGLVRHGRFLEAMAQVSLDQAWLAQAACHLLFLTRLDRTEAVRGPRSYRHALIEAGRLAQRLYLTAEQCGLGACGIGAFFDREAAALLRFPDATAMTYLLALGPVKKRL
ncbi:MAG: hypothetical protein AUK55_00885 [Syntrophobacteraceae bacterium CG2_30_61_12]|nr:MAG: hypothetical protein AUK55_00885 [Syntrophobacteraceae bacterium CG2_30_61_12]